MLKLVLFFLIFVFVLFIIFRKIFKVGSSFKMLGLAVFVGIIIFTLAGTIVYVTEVDYEMLGNSKDYAIGQVTYIDDKEIKIRIVEHNLSENIEVNSIMTIKLQKETVLKKQTNMLLEKEIKIQDIKVGNRINVICGVKNNNIIAQKIVVK